MIADVPLSKTLRTMYDDMVEDYEEARINDNAAKRERLHKHIAKLADQIQKQEEIEGEVIRRGRVVSFVSMICALAANKIKEKVPPELAAEINIEMAVELEEAAEAEGIA